MRGVLIKEIFGTLTKSHEDVKQEDDFRLGVVF